MPPAITPARTRRRMRAFMGVFRSEGDRTYQVRRSGHEKDWLRFVEDQIDDPAAADVLGRLPAVLEDVGVVAAGVFERVGEDWHPLEGAVIVDGLSESDGVGGAPGRIERDGTEGVAEVSR